jgi:hypothetical protein
MPKTSARKADPRRCHGDGARLRLDERLPELRDERELFAPLDRLRLLDPLLLDEPREITRRLAIAQMFSSSFTIIPHSGPNKQPSAFIQL